MFADDNIIARPAADCSNYFYVKIFLLKYKATGAENRAGA